MIKLLKRMDLSLDGTTVTDCRKGSNVSLSPQLEKALIDRGDAEEVRQIVVTKSEKVTKKKGKK